MRNGELAKTAGVTPDTIRFYEREGLIAAPPRTPSGYRDYGPEVLDDLVFIKKAQLLGLRLRDVREVLEISSGGRPPCEHVRARAYSPRRSGAAARGDSGPPRDAQNYARAA